MIDTLLFDGGGTMGISYIGVVKALEKLNVLPTIKTVSGTSIGSIFALLIVLEYTSAEILGLFTEFNIEKAFSLSVMNFVKKGIYGNDKYINKMIQSIIKLKHDVHITFSELYEKTNKKLVINTTCLCDNKPYHFDYENSPDMSVWLAVRMSVSLPYIYPSILYKEKYYVDGGLCSLPIHIYDPDKVLIFIFESARMTTDKKEKFYLLKQIINTIGKVNYSNYKYVVELKPNVNVISIPKDDEIKEMIRIGFVETLKFMKEKQMVNQEKE